MDWQTVLSVAAGGIAALTLLSRLLDKSLSIREHEEFRKNVDARFSQITDQFRRDVDRIEQQMKLVDQTKPTTGELATTASALEARIVTIERRGVHDPHDCKKMPVRRSR